MRKLIYFFAILGSILLLSLASCKKDCPDEPPPIDTLPDTSGCNPVPRYLSADDLSFGVFIYGDTIRYFKTLNSLYLFDRTEIANSFSGDCSNDFEYFGAAYLTTTNISAINYYLFPHFEPNFPENLFIKIGSTSQSGCLSNFKISTETDIADLDSIQLLDKIFYDVYYRTDDVGCASEMYYNKQYGVVGFNWQGEWYVLETDSL